MGYSDFLFTTPSFIEGVMRILDLGDTLTEFNRSQGTIQADNLALRQDWSAVGHDLLLANKKYLEPKVTESECSDK